jgi:anion transporter
MVAAISTNPQPAVVRMPRVRYGWILAALALGAAVVLAPTPVGLSRIAQLVLAILLFTVVLWISQAVNNGIASVLMMALLIGAGIKPALSLSGFGSPPFWVLLTVLFYGFAMKKTGLAERISYYILTLFPCTYAGILAAFFTIGFVLAFGIPSMTVRTAIMVPVAWALVESLNLPKRGRGSALIILTTVEMAVIPGLAFLYGALSGPIVEAAFQTKHLPISWLSYARVLTFPTILLCLLVLVANQIVLRPEAPLKASPTFAHDRLARLGKFQRSELITGLVVVGSIVFWTTDRYHHLPSFLVGMVAMAIFNLAGILGDQDIGTGVSWPLLLFLGGIFGLSNVIQEYKVTDWLASFLVPMARQLTSSILVLVLVMGIAMLLLRFIDPSSFIAISVLFLSVVDITSEAGIPPLVLMAAILITSVPFWLPYQNFWLAMGDGLTSSEAFTAEQRVRLANTYAVCAIATLAVSTAWWKWIGVIG